MGMKLAVLPWLERSARPRALGAAVTVILAGLLWVFVFGKAIADESDRPPNIVLILTDDQGCGDMGCHGNRYLKTPNLDRLYKQSIRLTNFHVDPTGAPTRAALLTGRYSCRTGVWHGMMGRSLLRRDETTMADIFAAAGYRTAVFGKWHLGDNYPYRPGDRGFHESLVHGGGGIGYTGDYWGNSYFDPVLSRNGKLVRTSGYCTDVFFSAAIKFIEQNRDRKFLVYLAPNVPHAPYQVPKQYSEPYAKAGITGSLAPFYGMITNFDENLGRLLDRLDRLGLAGNTVIVFLTDNGTSGKGFNVTMRGRKGSPYEGGHRVPCFIRWPKKLKGGSDVVHLTAHFDILPTLLDFAALPCPENIKLDGKGIIPLLVGVEQWAPRTLFVQSHRIENPMPWRLSAVLAEEYDIVNRPDEYDVKYEYRLVGGFELYDIKNDPSQTFNIGPERPRKVDKLRFDYQEWYKDVSKRFGEYCPIVIGSPKQDPMQLTCLDWHGATIPWHQQHIIARLKANGFWALEVARPGRYRFTLRERPAVARYALHRGAARIKIGGQMLSKKIPQGVTGVSFEMNLPAGATKLETWLADPDGTIRGAYYVEVRYLGPAEVSPKRPKQLAPEPPPRKPRRPSAYD